jgi:hypothetical protein
LTFVRPTLCRPDDEKSCFACCPPIRPPGYDHLPWRSSLTRLLVDNTRRFKREGPRPEPITGYFCWGLGFLDPAGKQIGCLLHPAQNQGRDLRHLTGYGDKCRRESCPPAQAFAQLTDDQQQCLLGLAQGLDSFQYSGPNLLRGVLSWGKKIAAGLADLEENSVLGGERLWDAYPLLVRPDLDGRAWLLEQLLDHHGPAVLARPDLAACLEFLVMHIRVRVMTLIDPPLARTAAAPDRNRPLSLIRFIRRGLGRPRLMTGQADTVREIALRELRSYPAITRMGD